MRELLHQHESKMFLEVVSSVSEGDEKASDAEEGLIHEQVMLVSHDEAVKIAQPSEGALHLPSLAVASQSASILSWRFASALAVRTDQFDPSSL